MEIRSEANSDQTLLQPLGAGAGIGVVGGVRRDAGEAQQGKEIIESGSRHGQLKGSEVQRASIHRTCG